MHRLYDIRSLAGLSTYLLGAARAFPHEQLSPNHLHNMNHTSILSIADQHRSGGVSHPISVFPKSSLCVHSSSQYVFFCYLLFILGKYNLAIRPFCRCYIVFDPKLMLLRLRYLNRKSDFPDSMYTSLYIRVVQIIIVNNTIPRRGGGGGDLLIC